MSPSATTALSAAAALRNNWIPEDPTDADFPFLPAGRKKESYLLCLPSEIQLVICKALHSVCDAVALRKTCVYFNALLAHHEMVICSVLSRSLELTVPLETAATGARKGGDRYLADIYTAEAYAGGNGLPSYSWVGLLQSRAAAVRSVESLNSYTPSDPYPATFLYRPWDHDVAHLFWRWCDIPDEVSAFFFLDDLPDDLCASVCEFYFTIVFAVNTLVRATPRPVRAGSLSREVLRSGSSDEEMELDGRQLVVDMVSELGGMGVHMWDLLKLTNAGLRPPEYGVLSIRERTAALLGAFVISTMARSGGSLERMPVLMAEEEEEEEEEEGRWPEWEVAREWFAVRAGDAIRVMEGWWGRTNMMFLFHGIRGHQVPVLIERCEMELMVLRVEMEERRVEIEKRDGKGSV